MIYKQEIKKYVPFYIVKDKGIQEWLNGKGERAKKKRDEAWKRMKRKPIQNI